jgi:hypothetical protein
MTKIQTAQSERILPKPIRATVVSKNDWANLVNMVNTEPTKEQVTNREEWVKFFFQDRLK